MSIYIILFVVVLTLLYCLKEVLTNNDKTYRFLMLFVALMNFVPLYICMDGILK